MKKPAIFMTILTLFYSSFVFSQKEEEIVDYKNFDTAFVKELLLNAINQYRSGFNLTPFKVDAVSTDFAEYDASYVCQNTFHKHSNDLNFFYYYDIPHQGILLKDPLERVNYFSSLRRVNRKLFTCINSSGFCREGFLESYSTFAIGTLVTWLQANDGYDKILQFNAECEEYIGIGISYKELISSKQAGYEVYVNVALTTDW
jgi:hypothetical protein